jgi:hypothetical protein
MHGRVALFTLFTISVRAHCTGKVLSSSGPMAPRLDDTPATWNLLLAKSKTYYSLPAFFQSHVLRAF